MQDLHILGEMPRKKLEDLHVLGQMPKNGPRDHDSLYENMVSMDLQETAPVCQIPRTAHSAFQENHGNLSKTMPKDNQKHVKMHQKSIKSHPKSFQNP